MPALLTTMSRRPEVVHDAGERLVDLLAVRHVGRIGASVDSGLRELIRGDAGRVGIDLEHGDRRSGLGELLRDAATEAGAGPCHDRDLPVEHTHLTAPLERVVPEASRSYPVPI